MRSSGFGFRGATDDLFADGRSGRGFDHPVRRDPPSGLWSAASLCGRVLVLANGEPATALVSMDVLGIDLDLRDEIRDGVREATGIGADSLLLNASHTHAGPATQTLRSHGHRDPSYVATFVEKVVGADGR